MCVSSSLKLTVCLGLVLLIWGCGDDAEFSTSIIIKGSSTQLTSSDPTSLRLKVYGVWMSKSEFCDDPVQIFSSASPGYTDFLGTPTLGSVDNSAAAYNGNWKCIIIQMSDYIKYTPATGDGVCVADTEYTKDACSAGSFSVGPNGVSVDCSATEDIVFLYLSTASEGAGSFDPWNAPTASNDRNGYRLGSDFVISGSAIGKFSVEGSATIDGSGSECTMDLPSFGFF